MTQSFQVRTWQNWGSHFKGMTLSQAFPCRGLPKEKYLQLWTHEFFWGHGFLTPSNFPYLQMLSQSTIELTNLLGFKPQRKSTRLQLAISFTDHVFGVVSYHNVTIRVTRPPPPNANPQEIRPYLGLLSIDALVSLFWGLNKGLISSGWLHWGGILRFPWLSLTSCEECQSMSASQAILNDVRDEKRAFPIQLRLVGFFWW